MELKSFWALVMSSVWHSICKLLKTNSPFLSGYKLALWERLWWLCRSWYSRECKLPEWSYKDDTAASVWWQTRSCHRIAIGSEDQGVIGAACSRVFINCDMDERGQKTELIGDMMMAKPWLSWLVLECFRNKVNLWLSRIISDMVGLWARLKERDY